MTDYTISYLIFEVVDMYFVPALIDGDIRMVEYYTLKYPN